MRHTDGGGTVQVWQTAGEVICQVADTGQFTDPLAWHQAPSDELPAVLRAAGSALAGSAALTAA